MAGAGRCKAPIDVRGGAEGADGKPGKEKRAVRGRAQGVCEASIRFSPRGGDLLNSRMT